MSSSNIYSLTCERCNTYYDKSTTWNSNRFCSRNCANSRDRSQELKDRVRATLKDRYDSGDIVRRSPSNKGQSKIPKLPCKVCGVICKPHRMTCSRQCFKLLTTQNALKQEKHGGGHKGRYKDIPCDSTYELAFLIWNIDQGINITRCDSVYPYTFKDKTSSYKPDFVVEGQEVEIKGFMSARAQAKLDQNPHVFVIDKINIQPFIKYVKHTYQVKDLRDLYDTPDHKSSCPHCKSLFTKGYKTQQYCSVSCGRRSRLVCE
jgi:hypothetical protein